VPVAIGGAHARPGVTPCESTQRRAWEVPIGPREAGRNARYTVHLVSILELLDPFAWAGPKEDVAAITSR